jgi:hypothetical protein
MDCPPERLFRPDVAIVAWRRWSDTEARQSPLEAEAATLKGKTSETRPALELGTPIA